MKDNTINNSDTKIRLLKRFEFNDKSEAEDLYEISFVEILYAEQNKYLPHPKECYYQDQEIFLLRFKAHDKNMMMEFYFTDIVFADNTFRSIIVSQKENRIPLKILILVYLGGEYCYDLREEDGFTILEFCSTGLKHNFDFERMQFAGKRDEVLKYFCSDNLLEKDPSAVQNEGNPKLDLSKFHNIKNNLNLNKVYRFAYINLRYINLSYIEENQYMNFPRKCYSDKQPIYVIQFENFAPENRQMTIFYFDCAETAYEMYDKIVEFLIDSSSDCAFDTDVYSPITIIFGGNFCYEMRYHEDTQIFDYCFTGKKLRYKNGINQFEGKKIDLKKYFK